MSADDHEQETEASEADQAKPPEVIPEGNVENSPVTAAEDGLGVATAAAPEVSYLEAPTAAPNAYLEAPIGPSPSIQATMAQMTDRMRSVIDAAERAAEAIRIDAQEQARRHLEEARQRADRATAERINLISKLTDDVVRRAVTVRAHSEAMVSALDDAVGSVTVELEEPGRDASRSIADPAPSPAVLKSFAAPASAGWPEGRSATAAAASPPQQKMPEDALLHATDLAAAGVDRATIARTLRDEFGVAVPGPIVDRVLGQK